MTALIEEYFGSISSGQITMGQMLILAGGALLVFSLLLSILFSIFKVKYKPEKARAEMRQPAQSAKSSGAGSAKTPAEPAKSSGASAQSGTVVLPKQGQQSQSGTVVLPKQGQQAQNGTVVLPKQGQQSQNATVVLPKMEQPLRTEKGTVILQKSGGGEETHIYGKEFGDTVDRQQVMRERQQ